MRPVMHGAWFGDLWRDLKIGGRVLRLAPGFALVAIVTLALGIGAATTVFSVVNGVLLAPLPYPDAHRIVRLFQIDADGRRMGNVSEPNFLDWKAGTRAFAAMAQMSPGPLPVSAAGAGRVMLPGSTVSREFFDVMGVGPVLGRPFTDEEAREHGSPAVIVSETLWRTQLGGRPLEDLTLRIDDRVHPVVGVMPAGFDYPAGSQFWTPREVYPPQTSRTAHNFQVVARLRDGVPLEAAVAEISALSRALKARYGDETWMSDATMLPLREQLTNAARPTLLLLFGAAIVLLVIACLNVSNLQIARASARRRELAVRLALGAGRGRLARQLLAEALVLSMVGAALGCALAAGGVRLLLALQPTNVPRLDNVAVDLVALSFAAGVAVLASVVLGISTAVRSARQDVRDALSEGTRSLAGGRRGNRVRQGLAIAQVALTIVLLTGAGLLGRSFMALLAVDPGYRTTDALLVDAQWTYSADPAVQQERKRKQQDLLTQLAALPGVRRAGLVNAYPLGGGNFANGQFLEMTRPDELQTFDDVQKLGAEAKNRAGFAGYRIASEDYFAAMGIRLVRGRLFDAGDGPDAPHVAVISESLAAAKWPGQDPLGRFVQFGNMDGDLRGFRIVGVVTDVREVTPESGHEPLFYGYYQQRMASRFTAVVQTDRGTALAPAVRDIVRRIDPDLPLQVRTVEEAFDRALAGRRFSLTLIALFGTLALALATLGIYGLISYLVAERTREIGIRLALGARSADVLGLVLTKGLMLAAAGLVLGVAAALLLTRFLEGMLFGVTPADPLSFAGVVALTLAAVLAATYVPARRALRVPPALTMRADG